MIIAYKLLKKRGAKFYPLLYNFASKGHPLGEWWPEARHDDGYEFAPMCHANDKCACGYNACKTWGLGVLWGLQHMDEALRRGGSNIKIVIAKVGLAGTVYEYQRGYRAQYQAVLGWADWWRVYHAIKRRMGISDRQLIMTAYDVRSIDIDTRLQPARRLARLLGLRQ